MNQVCLIGRLTGDPEGRRARDLEVCNFTLAIDRQGKDAGADFIRCTCFGKTAEFCEDYFQKGVRAGVTGRIQTGSYEDEDGIKRYTTDIIVDRLYFADGKRDPERKDDEKEEKRSDEKEEKRSDNRNRRR